MTTLVDPLNNKPLTDLTIEQIIQCANRIRTVLQIACDAEIKWNTKRRCDIILILNSCRSQTNLHSLKKFKSFASK